MSTFNADLFLSTSIEEANSTSRVLIPEGDYQAVIKAVKARGGVSEKSGEAYAMLNVTWVILDDEVKRITNEDEPAVHQSLFLDVLPNNSLDCRDGKNVDLGRLRAALGQNKPGKTWNPSMLQGGATMIKVGHKMRKDKEGAETGELEAIVKRIGKEEKKEGK